MIPPDGTTSFGGLKTEATLKKLQRLNLLMENKITEMNKVVDSIYKSGLYNESQLKNTKKQLLKDVMDIKSQRKAVKKMLSEHFGKTGEYLQSITNAKMSKYKFYGFLFLAIAAIFATFKFMKIKGRSIMKPKAPSAPLVPSAPSLSTLSAPSS